MTVRPPLGETPVRPSRDDWVERLKTLGRAQARYLWLLLVVGVFYLAVQDKVESADGAAATLLVPLVQLELSAGVVWASGPLVLSFILLAFLGSARAYSRAKDELGLDKPGYPNTTSEPLDTSPNAIDLAVYTSPKSPAFLVVLYLAYPLVVTLFLAEAAWLAYRVAISDQAIPGKWAWVVTGAALCLVAAIQVVGGWVKRVGQILQRTKS